MAPWNILCTITSYPPAIGGAQSHTHELMRRLAQRHRVTVASFWDRNRTDWLLGTTLTAPLQPRSYTLDGVSVQQVTWRRDERWRLLPLLCVYYALKTQAIAVISRRLAPKLAAVAPTCDLVYHARIGRESLAFASLALARQRDVPFLLVPYHHPRWVGWNYRQYLDLYRQADAVMALTDHERQTLIELGVQPQRIFVTGNAPVLATPPPPAGAFAGRYAPARSAPGPLILFLAQKYRYKGLEALLAAAPLVWQQHPEAWFAFVGPRTRFSERLFHQVSDPRLVEMGAVSLAEKTAALADCTVLCVPSSQESFGGVFTEAWALHKPVIGGPAPAVREVITPGADGFVVAQDPALIAEHLNLLLAQPGLAARMGQAGFAKVQAHFTWDALAAKTEQAIQAVLHRTA